MTKVCESYTNAPMPFIISSVYTFSRQPTHAPTLLVPSCDVRLGVVRIDSRSSHNPSFPHFRIPHPASRIYEETLSTDFPILRTGNFAPDPELAVA
jgi:hypothetical protein